jgi:hypothetical protein
MAVMRQGDGGCYRYRGTPKPDKGALEAEKIRKLLKVNRQRLAFNASSSRPLSARLNQHIAQALRDGMKVTRLAQTAGLSRWTVRTIGLTYDDLLPSGQPAEQQLDVIAAARRLRVMDDFELAALSGLQSEAIRKMTWGQRVQVL